MCFSGGFPRKNYQPIREFAEPLKLNKLKLGREQQKKIGEKKEGSPKRLSDSVSGEEPHLCTLEVICEILKLISESIPNFKQVLSF